MARDLVSDNFLEAAHKSTENTAQDPNMLAFLTTAMETVIIRIILPNEDRRRNQ
jgi:hypothetical protein